MTSTRGISSKFSQAFSELEENNKGLLFLLESSPLGIALIDHNKRYTNVNLNFAQSIGYTIKEVEGMNYEELTCPLFFAVDDIKYHEMVSGKKDSYHNTKQYFKKNGEAIDVRVDVFSYYKEKTDTIGFWGFYQRCRPFYKKYLPLVHPELEKLIHNNPLPRFLIFKEDGRILFGSRSAANLLGYSERELGTLPLRTVIEPVQADRLMSAVKRIVPGRFLECELTFYHREHSYIHMSSQVFLDDTNWFRSGRMMLIAFNNELRPGSFLQHSANEAFGIDLLGELKKINDSIQLLSPESVPEASINSNIRLSDFKLTHREREVLTLLMERRNTKEIAFDFGLAEITIRKYLTSLYRKFGVVGREDLLLLLHGKKIE